MPAATFSHVLFVKGVKSVLITHFSGLLATTDWAGDGWLYSEAAGHLQGTLGNPLILSEESKCLEALGWLSGSVPH